MASNEPGAPVDLRRTLVAEFLSDISECYHDYIEPIRAMGIDTVEELTMAKESELVEKGVPAEKAKIILQKAKKVVNNAVKSSVPAPAANSSQSQPSLPKLAHRYPHNTLSAPSAPITTTPISSWAIFRDVSRSEAYALLANQLNKYIIRKSSLYPGDKDVYAITLHHYNQFSGPELSNLLIVQRFSKELSGYEYMYVNDMLTPEAGNPAWSNKWFRSVHTMIKTRFPATEGPALLKSAGGHRHKTKKSNRTSRHKHTKKRKCTMRRKQTRRARH